MPSVNYIDNAIIFLVKWIRKVLVIEEGNNISVMQSNQNIPRRKLPYIVVHNPPISNNLSSSGNWDNRTDVDGNMEYVIKYEAMIRIEEVGSNGGLLNILLEYQNRQDIKDFWRANNISFLRNEAITDVSDIIENSTEKRAIMDIAIIYTNTTVDENGDTIKRSYNPGYIETVDLEGTYNGTVN